MLGELPLEVVGGVEGGVVGLLLALEGTLVVDLPVERRLDDVREGAGARARAGVGLEAMFASWILIPTNEVDT